MKAYFALAVAVLAAMAVSGCTSGGAGKAGNTVCMTDKCFSVEIADTPDERMQGLMGRDGLAEGAGMLFIFEEEENHSFWMKNMEFPLDIVWISSDMHVVYVSSYAQPCGQLGPCPSITPPASSMYVLEVGPGEAYGVGKGDAVTFSGTFK